jgi:hypothetical protein
MRSKAKKIGENDTWSDSLMSHKARCHNDAGPFSFGNGCLDERHGPFEEAEAFAEMPFVAETAS